jgi:hypothetical protein
MPADLRDRLAKLLCICGAQPDTVALFNLWKGVRSLADQPEPPGVMTVAMALMLPQVRDGSHWIEWTPRLCREMQFRFHPSSKQFDARPKDGDWQRVALVALSDLDAPCTLISSQGGAR